MESAHNYPFGSMALHFLYTNDVYPALHIHESDPQGGPQLGNDLTSQSLGKLGDMGGGSVIRRCIAGG